MRKFNFITLISFPGAYFCSHIRTITAISAAVFGIIKLEAVQSIKTIILKMKLTFREIKSQGFETIVFRLSICSTWNNTGIKWPVSKIFQKNSGSNLSIMAKT